MKNCNVLNAANGKKSGLHNKLLKIFKNQDQADLYYAKIAGPDFLRDFGDWVSVYKAANGDFSGMTEEQIANSRDDLGLRVDEHGEPDIHNKEGTNTWYFELKDGSILPLEHLTPLTNAFTPNQISEVSKFFLFNYVNEKGNKDLNYRDAETDAGKIMDSINRSIENYKKQVNKIKNEDKKKELLNKIRKIEAYKTNFRQELIYELNAIGQKVRTKITDANGNPDNEVKEEDKGGGINIKDSITVNAKETATVNTKIMLSQIRAKEVVLKDGKKIRRNKLSKYLSTSQFEDFDTIWGVLAPALSDITTSGTHEVSSSFSQMKKRISDMIPVYPWAEDLHNKLTELENGKGNDRWKAYEFVQAFNKTKIDYVVTEWDAKNKNYKVINATSTNSRESQLLDRWGSSFEAKILNGRDRLTLNQLIEMGDKVSFVTKIENEWNKSMKPISGENAIEKKRRESQAYRKLIPQLFVVLKELGIVDLQNSDFNRFVLQTGGVSNMSNSTIELLKAVKLTIRNDIAKIDSNGNPVPITVEGDFNNPFRNQKFLKLLAKGAGMRDVDTGESSVLLSEGKTAYAFANPSFISNKINEWKKDPSGLIELSTLKISKDSKWIRHLLALDVKNNAKRRSEVSKERLEKLQYSLASSFTSKGKNDAVDNTKISINDQINDNITKMLGQKLGRDSYFPAIIAADKSRRVEFKGFDMVNSGIRRDESGKLVIPARTVEIFVKYFAAEYNRMKVVSKQLRGDDKIPDEMKVQHYHTGNTNGLKSQLFPQFSHDSKETSPIIDGIKKLLYKDGHPIEDNNSEGFTDAQLGAVREGIRMTLEARFKDTELALSDVQNIDPALIRAYAKEGGNAAMVGDYLVNGLVSTIEYTKLFSGDPGYFKNLPDLIKRVPASFTDGLQLVLDSQDDLKFNIAVVDGVEVSSQYAQMIEDSLGPKDKNVADAYRKDDKNGGVNVTDAQAWITPNRWRFLKQRLGQWSDLHDSVFEKMTNGKELTPTEMKVAAQPLKGVYFEINNGAPTYLKYSQAVLIPSMIKDGPMKKLLDKMTLDGAGHKLHPSEEVHEVITVDGIKVGAMGLSKINEGDTARMANDFKLNPYRLTNAGWKLQQDLPIKTMHETNVGSQIQKNIFEGMSLEGDYMVDGKNIKGSELRQKIHDAVSDLIRIGRGELEAKLGIKDGEIQNKSLLYDAMVDEFVGRGGNENIIEALQRHTPFDAIPQIRGRVDSILMSMFNKAMTKISTEGGSFIQVSPFGFEDIADNKKTGIKIVSDRYNKKGLLPPRKGPDGQTLPGQVMIPHTLAVKILKEANITDFSKIDNDGWKKLFRDPKVRELIGYRIPNQGMSSNDTLEIVGVLPSTMGDSIIAYDGVPAKTGSDFDIDKMYVMAPNIRYNKKLDMFETITEENTPKPTKKEVKQISQNKLVSLYSSVLQSPNTYANMMRSIDSEYLKKDIMELFPAPKEKNLDLFSPVTQLKTKASYMDGKMGVALTANQLVDHVDNQSLDIGISLDIGFGVDNNKMIDKNINEKNIADVLSAFLNAYVDIAKDPYVTRGNHNDITANVAFMMIRAGVNYKIVNSFIGQPIIRDYVEAKKNIDSITSTELIIKKDDGTEVKVKDIETYFKLKGIKVKSVDNVADITNSLTDNLLRKRIKGKLKGDTKSLDSDVLNAFITLESKAQKFSAAVTAAKVDTKGAGGSPVQTLINLNKIRKVKTDAFVLGYGEKFKGTALGTYKENALDFTSSVLDKSKILLSGDARASDFFNAVSMKIKDENLLSDKLGQAINSAMYSYMVSGSGMMRDNMKNSDKLLVELPKTLNKLKEEIPNNFLIKELELSKRGGYNFIGINNKNKPASYENKIYRAWLKLYKSKDYKRTAVDLVKYSFMQSGFQSNLNQFFTHIPNKILRNEGLSLDMKNFFNNLEDMETDHNFFEQFMRHNWDNGMIVPKYTLKDAKSKLEQDLGKELPEDLFIPEFVNIDGTFMKYNGQPYARIEKMFSPTFKLGYTAGKNKIFEYQKDIDVEGSIIAGNNVNGESKVYVAPVQVESNSSNSVSKHQAIQEQYGAENIIDKSSDSGAAETVTNIDLSASDMEKMRAKMELKKLIKSGEVKKEC